MPVNKVYANADATGSVVCQFLPFLRGIDFINKNVCTPTDDTDDSETLQTSTATTIRNLLQVGLSLVFVGIIAIAIYIIIKAAIKYIRSEGDEKKVEEAQKAIKTVFIGVAALIIGIIGIVVITILLGAGGVFGEGTETCTGIPFLDTLLTGNSECTPEVI
jgi:uncharacterized membrane protein